MKFFPETWAGKPQTFRTVNEQGLWSEFNAVSMTCTCWRKTCAGWGTPLHFPELTLQEQRYMSPWSSFVREWRQWRALISPLERCRSRNIWLQLNGSKQVRESSSTCPRGPEVSVRWHLRALEDSSLEYLSIFFDFMCVQFAGQTGRTAEQWLSINKPLRLSPPAESTLHPAFRIHLFWIVVRLQL